MSDSYQHSIPESLHFFLVFKFSSFKFSFVICSDCNNKRFEESSQQHHLKKKKRIHYSGKFSFQQK